jgi:aconitate hydratase
MFREALKADLERLAAAAGKTEVKRATAASAAPEQSASAVAVAAEQASDDTGVPVEMHGARFTLRHGSVVIAAITSCTNTSNPSVMLGAGLLARNAVARGLTTKPWVKTSCAPGSKVVTDYYQAAGVMKPLEALGFHIVGYGCTTCIGNSGPLPEPIAQAVDENKLVVAAVLSGNRNFEGRVNPLTRFNYLMSPPLVVAYALAGRMDIDFNSEPLGVGKDGPVFLRDIWPSPAEVDATIMRSVKSEQFERQYANVFQGDEEWRALEVPIGDLYAWSDASTYVKNPPYFEGMTICPAGRSADRRGTCVRHVRGFDHDRSHLAGRQHRGRESGRPVARRARRVESGLQLLWRAPREPRGDDARHVREHSPPQQLAGGKRAGGPPPRPGPSPPIFDVAMEYQQAGTPLVVIAGKEYGTGSSRDWAAKGTMLLGIRAVIAESFERIHRSNLVGIRVLPLELTNGETRRSLV